MVTHVVYSTCTVEPRLSGPPNMPVSMVTAVNYACALRDTPIFSSVHAQTPTCTKFALLFIKLSGCIKACSIIRYISYPACQGVRIIKVLLYHVQYTIMEPYYSHATFLIVIYVFTVLHSLSNNNIFVQRG